MGAYPPRDFVQAKIMDFSPPGERKISEEKMTRTRR